jgi:hypothetical protein
MVKLVCTWNHITIKAIENKYKFTPSSLYNGSYLLSSNGGTFSSLDSDINNKVNFIEKLITSI